VEQIQLQFKCRLHEYISGVEKAPGVTNFYHPFKTNKTPWCTVGFSIYVSPWQINCCLYTSDITKYKGAFVLCDDTCIQLKVDFLWCISWKIWLIHIHTAQSTWGMYQN
jgi:hypothetical protein